MQQVLQTIKEFAVPRWLRRRVALAYRRFVRPRLPAAGPVRYAGIPTSHVRKWGDRTVPPTWRPNEVVDAPGYESTLVEGLRQHVRPGDRVVVVGGGIGVTAAIAALQAGPSGSVQCYEGAGEGVEKVRRTAALNDVAERVTVHHAVVARSIAVYGTEPDRAVVAPRDLPECDVLEMDCEGAEADILREMTIRPRVVLVETHGCYGSPTILVASLLRERGYLVHEQGVAEAGTREFCEANDIQVVVGVLEASPVPA